MMAEYLAKKLLVLGIKCIFSDGADSIGVFENNLEDIGVFYRFFQIGPFSLCAQPCENGRGEHSVYRGLYQ